MWVEEVCGRFDSSPVCDVHTTLGTDLTSLGHSETEGWGGLPRPPEQSDSGDTDRANEVKEGSHALTDEAEEVHDSVAELVEKYLRHDWLPMSVVTDCLVGYAKDLADKLRVEQDPVASKVLALRIDESAQWLGAPKVLLPHANRNNRPPPKANLRKRYPGPCCA